MTYLAVGFSIVLLVPIGYALGTLQGLRHKHVYPLLRLRDTTGKSRAAEKPGWLDHC